MRGCNTETAGMLPKKEGEREMETESRREKLTNKQEMRETAKMEGGMDEGSSY